MIEKITDFLPIFVCGVFAEDVILSKEKNQSLTKWFKVIHCVIGTEMIP